MGIKIGALLLFLLINSLVFAQQSKSEIPPQLHHYDKIGYDEDKTVVVSEWKSVNNGTGVYGNPKGILNLTCTAPYPIQWRIDGFIHPPGSVLIQPFQREVNLNYSPPRITFIGILVTYFFDPATDLASADILCESVEEPATLFAKLSVFVADESGLSSPFVQNATNLNLKDTTILPCGVTDPRASVQVIQMQMIPNREFQLNSHFYDHVHGYRLESGIPGTYICRANGFELTIDLKFSNLSDNVILPNVTSLRAFTHELIRLECSSRRKPVNIHSQDTGFEVLKSQKLSQVINLMARNATTGNITCTIGSLVHVWSYEFVEPPRIYMDNFEGEADCLTDFHGRSIATIRCLNPSHCEFLKRCFEHESSHASSCNLDRKHYFEDMRQGRCAVKTGEEDGAFCATIPYPHLNGLVQCRLAGIHRNFEFFVSLHFRRYSNWMEAPEHELIRLEEVNETLYTNHTVTFFCEAASYLFADSINFQLEFKNGTKQFAEQSLVKNPGKEDRRKIDEFNVLGILKTQLSLDVVGVLCLAPLWNSTDFLIVERKFQTKHLLPPRIRQKNATVTFTLGVKGQRLACEALGEPRPEVSWFGDIRELDPSIFRKSTASSTGESLLEFPAVEKKHEGKYSCQAVNFVGSASRTFYVVVEEASTSNSTVYGSVFGILIFVLLIVTLILFYVVRRFRMAQELFRKLSAEEVEEFLNGKEEFVNCFQDTVEGFYYLPYDRSYEVSMKDLHYDTKDMLGSGQFAVVLKGVLTGNDVAIKIPKSCADIIYFKSLLSEIKIMIHIGIHPHIVALMGACTEEIQERKVHIVVEYCELGSLESYLKKNKTKFQDLANRSQNSKTYENFSPEFTNVDMIRWAAEIADGMEFLASKSIIHADLATRNVLLTNTKLAKISDFGLSKQLYESNNYVKRTKVPLPWRWMALETLTTLTFSVESDVWSYGVTLWEIFTLADIPFPSETWDKDFLMRLSSGMRMGRPKYCTLEIYNQIITCWDEEPSLRPSFTYLKSCFENMIGELERK